MAEGVGVRTHGTVARTAVFKTAALNHSVHPSVTEEVIAESGADRERREGLFGYDFRKNLRLVFARDKECSPRNHALDAR